MTYQDHFTDSGSSPPKHVNHPVYVNRDGTPILETWADGTPAIPPKPLPDPVPIKKRRRRQWA